MKIGHKFSEIPAMKLYNWIQTIRVTAMQQEK
jgi:hypothetical protein